MSHVRGFISAGAAVGLGLLLSGCLGGGSSGGGSVRPASSAVEGTWQDPTGGLSSFRSGSFETVAADTGQKLSFGSYVMTSATTVEIRGTSVIRQARGEPSDLYFICQLISTNQLNCTTSSGASFALARRVMA